VTELALDPFVELRQAIPYGEIGAELPAIAPRQEP
jgi:hypothetical protein